MVANDDWRYKIPIFLLIPYLKSFVMTLPSSLKKIAFYESGIPRFLFCDVYSMSHSSRKPDFHDSLLFSSVGSRIVWDPQRKLCLNWGINNLQSKTSTIMWVCYFVTPGKIRGKESYLKNIFLTCIVKIGQIVNVSAYFMSTQSILPDIHVATKCNIIRHTSIEMVR